MKPIHSLALLLLLSTTNPADAASLFSVDMGTDELVRIDSDTGNVSVVGPLGFDATDVDLVFVGGRLFALSSDFEVRVDLIEIDPTTGSTISSVQVQTASRIVKLAEGLAQVGGQLKIGFRDDDAPPPFSGITNRLGDLGLNGLISNIKSGAPFLDFDGLGVNASTGQLYGADGNPFGRPGDTDFYTVTESPLSASVFHTTPAASGLAFSDLVVDGNTLFAIEFNTPSIYSFDLSTNSALPLVPLDRAGTYGGLALPEPQPELTALGPASIWIGLKNSDAVGLRLDLRAEVFVDQVPVGEGQLDDVASGSSGFNNARLNAIPLTLFAPADVPAGAELEIALSVRRTCSGGGHNSGTPRLWFNDGQANSRVGATIDGTATDFFLRDGFTLATTAGPGPKKTIDVPVTSQSPCPNRPFTPFGIWSTTLQ